MAGLDINGATLEYLEQGSGDSLVLVHGSASDYRTWQGQMEDFGRRYRTIAYSRRYHWPNSPIPEGVDYSMEEQVEDLRALLETPDIAPAHLVGHSYGAFLCLLLAIRRPDLVRTMVLAEPPAITLYVSSRPKPLELAKLSLSHPRLAAAFIRFGAQGLIPATRAFERGDSGRGIRAFGTAVFGAGGFEALPESRKRQVWDNFTNVKAELLGSGFLPLNEKQVRKVRTPSVLVTGQEGIVLFRYLTGRLAELLPMVDLVEIPGASHLMHEENPTTFNAAVLDFLPGNEITY